VKIVILLFYNAETVCNRYINVILNFEPGECVWEWLSRFLFEVLTQ
jgi:hypothetical protein